MVQPQSVYFFTLHKCASSLFSRFVLRNASHLKNVNYAEQIYRSERSPHDSLRFEDRGIVYGPIRLSAPPGSPVYERLVKPTTRPEFLKDKTAIFFVRDPRDVLVSSYHSFGWTHPLSPSADIRAMQIETRKRTQSMTVDEYALQELPNQVRTFEAILQAHDHCGRSKLLRYEDMINAFDAFAADLRAMLDLDDKVVKQIFRRTRPKDVEETDRHRRSGAAEGFRNHLRPETIDEINKTLKDLLVELSYNF